MVGSTWVNLPWSEGAGGRETRRWHCRERTAHGAYLLANGLILLVCDVEAPGLVPISGPCLLCDLGQVTPSFPGFSFLVLNLLNVCNFAEDFMQF